MMIRFLIGFFVFSLSCFSAQLAQAAMMTNPHYTIENQDINILPFQTIQPKHPRNLLYASTTCNRRETTRLKPISLKDFPSQFQKS